jgi:hypothetical protein
LLFPTYQNKILLLPIDKSNKDLKKWMDIHYSNPKGFVGRQIIYLISFNSVIYGAIAGGSATLHLIGRNEFFTNIPLTNIINNTFFHIEKVDGKYPLRNFSTQVVSSFRSKIQIDWLLKYKNEVLGFETLVELPRTGDLYIKDGWTEVGQTVGYTCKRTAGKGTDSWTGKRVWDTENLRPKRIFCRYPD